MSDGRATIVSIFGTRPNFMKIAPVAAALGRRTDSFRHLLVHTGQHYDRAMSEAFLEDLGLGEPDHQLSVGSGTHTEQTARVMERLEPVLLEARPDFVLVPGDVNSTLAASLVAAQLRIPIGHIEAGLRSFDRTMPEELNRVLTDQASDLLFIHSPEAEQHLRREGRPPEAIHYVGNTMIDTLIGMQPRISRLAASSAYGLEPGTYLVVTLHRPALVDGALLAQTIRELDALADELPVVFPAHPRTRAAIEAGDLLPRNPAFRLLEPLGYLEFLSLVGDARAVLTDSGGIQEETTYLGVPCFTLRDNTERPVTCELGTNTLLGLAPERLAEIPASLQEMDGRARQVPPLWDGHAADRIVDVLSSVLDSAVRRPA